MADRLVLGRLLSSRRVKDPEFAVEGIEPKHRTAHVREIFGRLAYINYTQIFSACHPSDPEVARTVVERALALALNHGRQAAGGDEVGQRLTAGLSYLEEFVGAPIDPAFCRLAVLRPLEVRWIEPHIPPDRDVTRARELGFEIVTVPGYYECLCEVGLDLAHRPR